MSCAYTTYSTVHVHVYTRTCVESTSGLVVVRSEPHQCGIFSITPLPVHPVACIKLVDKTTDCGDHNILNQ